MAMGNIPAIVYRQKLLATKVHVRKLVMVSEKSVNNTLSVSVTYRAWSMDGVACPLFVQSTQPLAYRFWSRHVSTWQTTFSQKHFLGRKKYTFHYRFIDILSHGLSNEYFNTTGSLKDNHLRRCGSSYHLSSMKLLKSAMYFGLTWFHFYGMFLND